MARTTSDRSLRQRPPQPAKPKASSGHPSEFNQAVHKRVLLKSNTHGGDRTTAAHEVQAAARVRALSEYGGPASPCPHVTHSDVIAALRKEVAQLKQRLTSEKAAREDAGWKVADAEIKTRQAEQHAVKADARARRSQHATDKVEAKAAQLQHELSCAKEVIEQQRAQLVESANTQRQLDVARSAVAAKQQVAVQQQLAAEQDKTEALAMQLVTQRAAASEAASAARAQGYDEARAQGYDEARAQGYDEGYVAGYQAGEDVGYDKGAASADSCVNNMSAKLSLQAQEHSVVKQQLEDSLKWRKEYSKLYKAAQGYYSQLCKLDEQIPALQAGYDIAVAAATGVKALRRQLAKGDVWGAAAGALSYLAQNDTATLERLQVTCPKLFADIEVKVYGGMPTL